MTNIDPMGAGPVDAGEGSTGSAKEKMGQATQKMRDEAAHFASQAQQKAAGEIERRKATASQTLGQFATAIRKAGDELAEGDQSVAGRFVGQAADGLENFARTLSERRPEELLDSVRDFSRRNPTAFVAGAVLAGLAIGRFLRSSEQAPTVGESRSFATTESAVFTGVGEDGGGLGALETQVSGDIAGVAGPTDTFGSDLSDGEGDDVNPGGEIDRSRFGPGA
ncbi:hypothetical protein [Phenylobacterium sp.]|uniref:hypothetical protein n=1 Tax=Phenylobacterium sp. TaxID=1871053 RepID=UPI002C3B4C8B|nr:hypothetical protein [Phenylobacterium sp.]HVI33807.1 hypothetical protein [Phenylobacterium sp.]